MSTQIVQFPRQAEPAGPVRRLGRAVEQPVRTARAVQKLRFTAGQIQFQARYLQQHVEAGTATTGMVSSLRTGLWRIEQQLERLVDGLGSQHVELDELHEELTGLLDAVLDRDEPGAQDGLDADRFVGTAVRSGKTGNLDQVASARGRWSA